MLFLLVIPLAIFIVGFGLLKLSGSSFGESLGASLFYGVVACVFGLVLALLIGLFVSYEESDFEKTTEVKQLAAFNDRFSTAGSFFLGSGSVNESAYYYFYERLPDGGKRMGKVEAIKSMAVVYEEDRTDGRLEIRSRHAGGELNFFYLKFPQTNLFYKFVVPKGSVMSTFRADLE